MNYFGDPSKSDSGSASGNAPEARAGVGTLLRATRLRLGQELQDISSALRIRNGYLQALEDGDMASLPGTAYAIGFVRAYAGHLGLDSEEVVRRYKAEVNATQHRTELIFPAPVPDSGIPRGAVLLMAMVVAGAAYGGWYYLSSVDKRVVDLVAEPSGRLMAMLDGNRGVPAADGADSAAPAGVPAPAAAAPTAEPDTAVAPAGPLESATPVAETPVAAASVTDTPAAEVPVAAASADVSTAAEVAPTPTPAVVEPPVAAVPAPDAVPAAAPDSQPAETETPQVAALTTATITSVSDDAPVAEPADAAVRAIPQAPAETIAAAGGQTFGAVARQARIVLRAREDAWVQVRDASNGLVLTRMLRAGDIYRVPPRDGLRLITGNAGALEIVVDGQVTPPLGEIGVVRRDVPLDAEQLLAGIPAN